MAVAMSDAVVMDLTMVRGDVSFTLLDEQFLLVNDERRHIKRQ